MPSKPVAMTHNSLVVNHNRFGFEILKMDSKAFFFQCTTIFVGICNEETVKIAGMRRINEMSKGAYLISSAGWSYHHKDERYNRIDNVVQLKQFRAGRSERMTRSRWRSHSTSTWNRLPTAR